MATPKARVNRAVLDPAVAMMAEQLDDLRDGVLAEVRGMRQDSRQTNERALSIAKWFVGLFALGGLVTLIGGGGVIYYTLSLFGELRGIDTSRAANSASVVISSTSDAVKDIASSVPPSPDAPTLPTPVAVPDE